MQVLRAKKSLGQNFLIDEEALVDIAHATEIRDKCIIEVGPGYGALTQYLLAQDPASLDLVELDTDMISLLKSNFDDPRLTIHHQDVLTYRPPYEEYRVIANIPYYITSPILFHFLYGGSNGMDPFFPPEEMVIMMQEEVGTKILGGRSKKPHHSLLSLAMEQACSDIEIVRYVGKISFDPAPKVDSIVLRFVVKKNRDFSQEKKLIHLWKVAFTHPRKTLLSNLKGTPYSGDPIREILGSLGYDEKVRAEAITLNDWYHILTTLDAR